jgi:hypothetical protein
MVAVVILLYVYDYETNLIIKRIPCPHWSIRFQFHLSDWAHSKEDPWLPDSPLVANSCLCLCPIIYLISFSAWCIAASPGVCVLPSTVRQIVDSASPRLIVTPLFLDVKLQVRKSQFKKIVSEITNHFILGIIKLIYVTFNCKILII